MTKTSVTRWILFALIALGIGLAIYYRDLFNIEALEQWVDNSGWAGPVVFMLLYMAATVLFLPGSVLTLAGGALFGPVFGTFYSLTGATIGAMLAFLIARYLAGDWVQQRAGPKLAAIIKGVDEEGWRFVAFVRLVPLFPFNLLNYALGLTRVRVWHYVVTSYICMLPGAFAYTWLGYAGRQTLAGEENTLQTALIAIAIFATVAYLPRIIKRLRKPPADTAE